jgi:hypothetical protein
VEETLQMGNRAGNVSSKCREVIFLPGFGNHVKKCNVKFCYIKIIRQILDKNTWETSQEEAAVDLG